MGDKEEAGRLLNVLKMSAGLLGLSGLEIDRRLGSRRCYINRLFAGRRELKVEHLMAIVQAIGLRPWELFELAYPQPAGPPSEAYQAIRTMLRDLQPPEPASAPALTEREIDRRVQESVRQALRETGAGKQA